METADSSGSLPPSPRHMRKRRFHGHTPGSPRRTTSTIKPIHAPLIRRKSDYNQKRFVALTIVILVSISIPVLAFTLIFGR